MEPPKYDGVILDTHIYEMFTVAVCPLLSNSQYTL